MWHPPASSAALSGDRSEKEQRLLPTFFSGGKRPLALSLIPDNSVPPYMSFPFSLLPLCWSSEIVSLSKLVHELFKRNCLGFQQFLSPPASITTCFYSQKLWRLIFLVMEPWAGGPGVGLGLLAPEISLLICIHHI